jgi:hypothetical protein
MREHTCTVTVPLSLTVVAQHGELPLIDDEEAHQLVLIDAVTSNRDGRQEHGTAGDSPKSRLRLYFVTGPRACRSGWLLDIPAREVLKLARVALTRTPESTAARRGLGTEVVEEGHMLVGGVWIARNLRRTTRPGHCAGCGVMIAEGQLVAWDFGGRSGNSRKLRIFCSSCGPHHPVPRVVGPVGLPARPDRSGVRAGFRMSRARFRADLAVAGCPLCQEAAVRTPREQDQMAGAAGELATG